MLMQFLRMDITDMAEVKNITFTVLRGLRWMHRHGILHRDLKRENIFYDAAGKKAVIADFGIVCRCRTSGEKPC